ncbi:MAG: serine/threonine-protein kinase, partial [Planctomycetota bacterium]
MNSSPIDYDLLFAGNVVERQWLNVEQVAHAQLIQKKLRQFQIFHSLGKICLELHLLTRKQTLEIQEDIQKTCKLTEKPLLNIFLFPSELAEHFWDKIQKIPLLSAIQIQHCVFLQNTLHALGVERNLAEIALEEKFLTPSQLETFVPSAGLPILNSSIHSLDSKSPIHSKPLLPSALFPSEFFPTSMPTETTQPEVIKTSSETKNESDLLESLAKEIQPQSSNSVPLLNPTPVLQNLKSNLSFQLEDYEILHEISRGGMGIIYKVRQKKLDRIVALKLLKGGEEAPASLIERFNLEAKSLAQLSHPNILPIYDSGIFQNCPYFVMEYVDGQSLKEMLKTQKLPLSQIVHIIRSVAKALHHAHEKG